MHPGQHGGDDQERECGRWRHATRVNGVFLDGAMQIRKVDPEIDVEDMLDEHQSGEQRHRRGEAGLCTTQRFIP